jgi:hypothetical protein
MGITDLVDKYSELEIRNAQRKRKAVRRNPRILVRERFHQATDAHGTSPKNHALFGTYANAGSPQGAIGNRARSPARRIEQIQAKVSLVERRLYNRRSIVCRANFLHRVKP